MMSRGRTSERTTVKYWQITWAKIATSDRTAQSKHHQIMWAYNEHLNPKAVKFAH